MVGLTVTVSSSLALRCRTKVPFCTHQMMEMVITLISNNNNIRRESISVWHARLRVTPPGLPPILTFAGGDLPPRRQKLVNCLPSHPHTFLTCVEALLSFGRARILNTWQPNPSLLAGMSEA